MHVFVSFVLFVFFLTCFWKRAAVYLREAFYRQKQMENGILSQYYVHDLQLFDEKKQYMYMAIIVPFSIFSITVTQRFFLCHF